MERGKYSRCNVLDCKVQLCAAWKAGKWEEVSIPDPIISRTARCYHVLPGKLENGERIVFQTQCPGLQGAIMCCVESWRMGRG